MKSGNVAIFASGGGSNALKIIERLQGDKDWQVVLILTNKPDAGVVDHAKSHDIPYTVVDRQTLYDRPESVLNILKEYDVSFIVLGGFLLKIPDELIDSFGDRIINIHPSLLPDFGGKGMYGDYVHQAVIESGRKRSGITIHRVNGHYDEGDIIFQASIEVAADETVPSLRKKIQSLEHRWFPEVLMALLKGENIPQPDED